MASKKKDYTVVGNHNVMGHAPGESFSAVMTDEQEEVVLCGCNSHEYYKTLHNSLSPHS